MPRPGPVRPGPDVPDTVRSHFNRKILDLQRRYDEQYGRIEEIETHPDSAKAGFRVSGGHPRRSLSKRTVLLMKKSGRRCIMTDLIFYRPDEIPDDRLQIAVVAARYQGRWVFCRHKQRVTWEMPGGHKEQGETIADAAKRELWEETGAAEFELTPIHACRDKKFYGMLYYADIKRIESIPAESEMAEIKFSGYLPEKLTYPELYQEFFAAVQSWLHL